MLSYEKTREIVKKILDLRKEAYGEAILVSLDENREAKWGQVCAATEGDMREALEPLGMNTEGMLSAEDFLDQDMPTFRDWLNEEEKKVQFIPLRAEEYELPGVADTVLCVRDQWGQNCFLCYESDWDSVMDSQMPAWALASGEEYQAFCEALPHQEGLEKAFEAEFGERNWP